jgi:hypothetical protein
MRSKAHLDLSRRERQIMEAIYRLGSATVSETTAAALLDLSAAEMTDEELDRLSAPIPEAKKGEK